MLGELPFFIELLERGLEAGILISEVLKSN
jgi:pilus assembly protein TadC